VAGTRRTTRVNFRNPNDWCNNPDKGPIKFDSSTILQGCRINISPNVPRDCKIETEKIVKNFGRIR